MVHCDNTGCTYVGDELIDSISDYRIIDGMVLCLGCAEDLEEGLEYDDDGSIWPAVIVSG